jgi:flavodoxin
MHRFTATMGEPDYGPRAEVVQIRAGQTLEDALEEIYNGEELLRLSTEILILRAPVEGNISPGGLATGGADPADLAQILQVDDFASAFARYEDRPVHLLSSYDGQHYLSGNLNPNFDIELLPVTSNPASFVENIRVAEFEHIMDRSRAVISSAPGTVLVAPSGRLVRNFIRVGNIQYDRDAIDAVFFWLLPYLKRCAAVLTDTWSISSIALNIAAQSRRYFGGPERRVELLPDYIGTSPGSAERARAIIERLVAESPVDENLDEILCLVSATQSGSLRGQLNELIADGKVGRFTTQYVALFGLGDTGMTNLHNLEADGRFRLLDEANDGTLSDLRIPIDAQVYFPLNFKDHTVEVTKPIAEASREVLDALSGHEVIKVHRDVEEGYRRRHQAIYIDTERLLDVPEFVERLDVLLSPIIQSPILIIAPPIEGAQLLANHIADRLQKQGHRAPVLLHDNLKFDDLAPPTPAQSAAIASIRAAAPEEELIIVTGSWMNDASLTQYQKGLRDLRYQGRVRYIVGLARPESEARWTRTCRRLTSREGTIKHEAVAVMTLPLPDWDNVQCPWCEESRLYARWAKDQPLPPLLAERRDKLQTASREGSMHDLLLSIEGKSDMLLGPDSFFLSEGTNDAELFAAMASAFQRLRTRDPAAGPPLGPKRFPVSTVLQPVDYTDEVWSDSILRAMILRGATANELVYVDPVDEAKRTQSARDLITRPKHDEHNVLLEVLLAAGLEKIELKADDELRNGVRHILDGKPDTQIAVEYMLDRIEADQAFRRARAFGTVAVEEKGNEDDLHTP